MRQGSRFVAQASPGSDGSVLPSQLPRCRSQACASRVCVSAFKTESNLIKILRIENRKVCHCGMPVCVLEIVEAVTRGSEQQTSHKDAAASGQPGFRR